MCYTIAALVAMGPHLLGTAADVPWSGILWLLIAVFLVGLLSAIAAIRTAVRSPILPALRGD